MKKQYDIIVVGAGPGGSSAALTAAKKGSDVIVIEEHPQIGIPRHCTGFLPDSAGYNAEIRKMVGEDYIIRPSTFVRAFGPTGKLLQETPMGENGGCLIRREEFDREWAKLAAGAGAHIVLNTRVTGILKEKGQIAGVTTNSDAMPEVRGKLVIAAGGYRALHAGIPKEAGLTRPGEEFHNGVHLELTNVKDIEPTVTEIYYGGMPRNIHLICIEPIDENSCWSTFGSLAEFEQIKKLDHPYSRKVKNAIPVQMLGYVVPWYFGNPLPKTVSDGLILIGSAAGYNGMVPAILTGRYAAEVAVDALQKGDVTEARLNQYEIMCRNLGLDHEYDYWINLMRTVRNTPDDEALEKALIDMAQRGIRLMPRLKLPF